jgi:uracil-DNA glycosylase
MLAADTFVTVHPSALVRIPDRERRHTEVDRFVAELRRVAERIG